MAEEFMLDIEVEIGYETSGSGKVDESWHQCPQSVRNFIADVDYTNVPYTQSSISSYAPTPPNPAANTKPIGKTIDGVTYYNNIPGTKTPFASENVAGTIQPLDQVRWINSVTNNMRDLGGRPCDGGTVKYGLLYRSADLVAADENLITNELKIRTEVDLTSDGTPAYGNKLRYVSAPASIMYSLNATAAWSAVLGAIFEAVSYGSPTVFHCSMGADRTGTVACVLEGLLGVSQSDIDKYYELTSFYALRARNGNYQGGTSDWAHLIAEITALPGNSFRDKCVSFVLSLGFTIAEINVFRAAMIDGTPETLVAPIVTVAGTYTGCSTSNNSASATLYGAYNATITPSQGYTLTGATVSVKMGGVDITSTAYSNGVIGIASVTGDIIISVMAKVDDRRVELFDPSTATINMRLSSTGETSASNGHFVTDFIPVSGLDMSRPWRIHIRDTADISKFQASVSNEGIAYFKSDKALISEYGRLIINTNSAGTNTLCKHNDDGTGGVYVDINKTGDGNFIPSNFFDLSQVAYIRLSFQYSSSTIASTAALANVSIKADEITA